MTYELRDQVEEYLAMLPRGVLYLRFPTLSEAGIAEDAENVSVQDVGLRFALPHGAIAPFERPPLGPAVLEYIDNPFARYIIERNTHLYAANYDPAATPHGPHMSRIGVADVSEKFYLEAGAVWAVVQECDFLDYFNERRGHYFNERERPIPVRLARDLAFYYCAVTYKGDVYIYDAEKGIFKEGREEIVKAVQSALGEDATEHYTRETVEAVKRISIITGGYPFDQARRYICVRNGVYDIESGELIPHSPLFAFTRGLEITYRPDADCPAIDEFLHEIVAEEDVPLLYEIAGYCLYNGYPVQKAFMLIGDGSNGKSTYLQLLIRFLGKDNVASVPLQNFDHNRFSAAQLLGKLANICADLPPIPMKYTGIFKMLTGGDAIYAEKKYKDAFTFVNTAKLIFSANATPQVTDQTYAFWRRWILIKFPYKFEGDNCDPHILEKLTTDEELSGFFNRAVEALRRVLERGAFSASHTAEELMREWKKRADSVYAFICDCVEIDANAYEEKDEIYRAYCQYCSEHGMKALAKNIFSMHFMRHTNAREVRKRLAGRRVQMWQGVRLKPFDEESPYEDYILAIVRDTLAEMQNFYPRGVTVDELTALVQEKDRRITRAVVEKALAALEEEMTVARVSENAYKLLVGGGA